MPYQPGVPLQTSLTYPRALDAEHFLILQTRGVRLFRVADATVTMLNYTALLPSTDTFMTNADVQLAPWGGADYALGVSNSQWDPRYLFHLRRDPDRLAWVAWSIFAYPEDDLVVGLGARDGALPLGQFDSSGDLATIQMRVARTGPLRYSAWRDVALPAGHSQTYIWPYRPVWSPWESGRVALFNVVYETFPATRLALTHLAPEGSDTPEHVLSPPLGDQIAPSIGPLLHNGKLSVTYYLPDDSPAQMITRTADGWDGPHPAPANASGLQVVDGDRAVYTDSSGLVEYDLVTRTVVDRLDAAAAGFNGGFSRPAVLSPQTVVVNAVNGGVWHLLALTRTPAVAEPPPVYEPPPRPYDPHRRRHRWLE